MIPLPGYYTLIHHDGPLVEWSDNITERHWCIDIGKPAEERTTRHRCIVRIPEDLLPQLYRARAAYEAVERPAMAAYQAVGRPAMAAYLAVVQRPTTIAAYLAVEEIVDADPATLALVRELIPDCPWDEAQQTIFPKPAKP